MAISVDSITRLKSQLLASGIQQKNQPLWQVIDLLIQGVLDGFNQVNSQVLTPSSGGTGVANQTFITVNNDTATLPNSRQLIAGEGIQLNPSPNGKLVISSAMPLGGGDGGEGEDGPPGPPGLAGVAGATGPPGPAGIGAQGLDGVDGEDGEDSYIPGPPGQTGPQGIQGNAGMPGIPGEDGEDGLDSFIPGPMGPAGTSGATDTYAKIFMHMGA